MAVVKRKTVAPYYAVGAVWLVWSAAFPLYRVSDYLLCAGVSCAAALIARAVWPDRTWTTAEPEAPKAEAKAPEGDKEADSPELAALKAERARAVGEMRRLNESIKDPDISAQIDRLEGTAQKIMDAVVEKPEKLPQIRKFLNYYLPTTLKLLNAYDRMDATGVSGENIDGTKERVAQMLETVCAAFDKQLDALFGEEALDISTDIKVMEQMLQQEGFGGMTM